MSYIAVGGDSETSIKLFTVSIVDTWSTVTNLPEPLDKMCSFMIIGITVIEFRFFDLNKEEKENYNNYCISANNYLIPYTTYFHQFLTTVLFSPILNTPQM